MLLLIDSHSHVRLRRASCSLKEKETHRFPLTAYSYHFNHRKKEAPRIYAQ